MGNFLQGFFSVELGVGVSPDEEVVFILLCQMILKETDIS
jgi:hypothetical protein